METMNEMTTIGRNDDHPTPETSIPRLDVARLRAELHRIEIALRRQKDAVKRAEPHETRPLWSALRQLKRQATLLCAIQAHRRGRLHLRRCLRSHAHLGLPQVEVFTFELQAKLIGEAWRPYALPEQPEDLACEALPRTAASAGGAA